MTAPIPRGLAAADETNMPIEGLLIPHRRSDHPLSKIYFKFVRASQSWGIRKSSEVDLWSLASRY